ncbi:hypothetical protein GE09DRAFT_701562 [Coniochaeta sp. 2T2.1]|nr:hypothetical protein GE09DRAFT_701562 [Coniochaeta sp. 2T2.1]
MAFIHYLISWSSVSSVASDLDLLILLLSTNGCLRLYGHVRHMVTLLVRNILPCSRRSSPAGPSTARQDVYKPPITTANRPR